MAVVGTVIYPINCPPLRVPEEEAHQDHRTALRTRVKKFLAAPRVDCGGPCGCCETHGESSPRTAAGGQPSAVSLL